MNALIESSPVLKFADTPLQSNGAASIDLFDVPKNTCKVVDEYEKRITEAESKDEEKA